MYSGGVTQSVGESDDHVSLVCRISVPVRHRDLQGDVLLGWCDDGNISLPDDTMKPHVIKVVKVSGIFEF